MDLALRVGTDLEPLACGECGITFAVPIRWIKERRDHSGEFYCPNGHVRVFRESEVDRLRREVRQANESRDWYKRQVEARDKQLAASRGQMTKLRNRIQRGVCPECRRSFENLRRHMVTQHPQLALPEK